MYTDLLYLCVRERDRETGVNLSDYRWISKLGMLFYVLLYPVMMFYGKLCFSLTVCRHDTFLEKEYSRRFVLYR